MPARPPRGLVVVGASAGGVEALSALVATLPPDLPAAVLVVVHVPASGTSALPTILDRRGPLPVRHARDGDPLVEGEILVAPPDHHLLVDGDRVAVTRGPQENGHRPAVDVLFRSAARARGASVVAVVLSGALDDGAAGVVSVKSRGGRCVVQSDPLFDGMVRSTTEADHPDASVPAAEIAATLTDWLAEVPAYAGNGVAGQVTGETVEERGEEMDEEVAMAAMDASTMHLHERPGDPAGFGCPDCAGALFRIEEGNLVRFRCRVGHAWSSESLLVRQTVALESALWMALRSLEEKAALNQELGDRAAAAGHDRTAARFAEGAHEATRAAELVRRLVIEVGETGAAGSMEGVGG
jgi:two-component system, chemotaxis family, protein-glutamate methylesterase/glutaminase